MDKNKAVLQAVIKIQDLILKKLNFSK